MTADNEIRASDHDRDSTVAVLRDAYTAGRLDLDEFDERTTAAYTAKTWGDLRRLTTDLPAAPHVGADLPVGAVDPVPVEEPDQLAAHRSRWPFAPMIPLALVWLAIAATAHSPELVLPLVIIALFTFRAAAWRNRRPRPSQHGGSDPQQRDDAR